MRLRYAFVQRSAAPLSNEPLGDPMIVSVSRHILTYEFTVRTDDSPKAVQSLLERFISADAGTPLVGMRFVAQMNGAVIKGNLLGNSALHAKVDGAVALADGGGSDVMFRVAYSRWWHAGLLAFGMFIIFLFVRDFARLTITEMAMAFSFLAFIAAFNTLPTWMVGSFFRREIEKVLSVRAPIA